MQASNWNSFWEEFQVFSLKRKRSAYFHPCVHILWAGEVNCGQFASPDAHSLLGRAGWRRQRKWIRAQLSKVRQLARSLKSRLKSLIKLGPVALRRQHNTSTHSPTCTHTHAPTPAFCVALFILGVRAGERARRRRLFARRAPPPQRATDRAREAAEKSDSAHQQ